MLIFIILVAYMLFDVSYFLRSGITFLVAKYFKRKIGILESSTVYGITLPSDVDFNLSHINNARVLREFDFGRMELGFRTGVFQKIFAAGGAFPVSANFVRYRLPVNLFSVYKIETRVTNWDDKNVYLEQKLITLFDNITRAVAYPKIACYKFNGYELIEEISPGVKSPKLDQSLQKINEICQISSLNLKKTQPEHRNNNAQELKESKSL